MGYREFEFHVRVEEMGEGVERTIWLNWLVVMEVEVGRKGCVLCL